MTRSKRNHRCLPLLEVLETEGLLAPIERGLSGVAPELGQDRDAFARAALESLRGWRVRPSTAVSRFGSVSPHTKTLRLTALDCSREARHDTLLHEVAHIVTYALVAEPRHHGPRWRKIAVALGAMPRSRGEDPRFKQAAMAVREQREKTVARCDRCGYEVKRMRRVQRNWQHYSHRDCGGQFSAVPPPR